MTVNPRNRRKPDSQGGRIAALAVLVIVIFAVFGYLMFAPAKKSSVPHTVPLSQPLASAPSPDPKTAPLSSYSAADNTPRTPGVPNYHPTEVQTTEEPQSAPLPRTAKGRLAIIIDDMGSSMQEVRALTAIGVPLTFSIIPGLRSYRDVAAFADAKGYETMIHIPMQSKGWPERRLETNGLLVSMPADAVTERVNEFLRSLPKAKGVNNHMGSEFTEHEEGMRAVMAGLKERGLFFVDSVTTPKSVGVRLAQELGVRSARRNVFLDNEQERDYITGQLNQAARMAKKNGSAIAICHPHPETIKTLEQLLPTLAGQGVILVPASELVK